MATTARKTKKTATRTRAVPPAQGEGRRPARTKSQPAQRAAKSRKQPEKDPQGGLTAAGRAAFARKDGSYLRPGVTGKADTPEKQRRKGSFLRRHFANPRGPMQKDGEPTRLALSAHAWGEAVPKTLGDAKRLAAKGKRLLEQYERSKAAAKRGKKTTAKRIGKTGKGRAGAAS